MTKQRDIILNDHVSKSENDTLDASTNSVIVTTQESTTKSTVDNSIADDVISADIADNIVPTEVAMTASATPDVIDDDDAFLQAVTSLSEEMTDEHMVSSSRKKKRNEFELTEEVLLEVFHDAQRPLKLDLLLRILGLQRKRKRELEQQLEQLQAGGQILRLRGGAWGLVKHLKMLTGRLVVQRTGVGFVLPEDRRRGDVFIHPSQMGEAWHGDKVAVVLLPGGRGKSQEGRIVRVLERVNKEVPVRVVKRMGRSGILCRPADSRINVHMLVTLGDIEGRPQKDDILVVAPEERIEEGLWAARALRLLGTEDDVSVQERLVKINHGIPTSFPDDVLQEAQALPLVPSESDFADRIDLRHLEFVTIDGARARDFDDAIYVEEQGSGWRLWVAIADVSHYVRPESSMDREALERSNSYYFPQSVEPMFPEALSNGLCSLNPRVARLAMVAEMYIYMDGSSGKSKFYPAVIESKARLTYGQVNRALFLNDADERVLLHPVLPLLERAERLARVLYEMRTQRGSLNFDLPEPELAFNVYGETVDIKRKVRHFGHQIIEECMIAANEAVARFLTEKEADFLYRVHPEPEPEKLTALFKALAQTDLAFETPREITPAALQAILQKAHGSSQEFLVSRLVLRTMMQARYTPEHEGHFGLASTCYCHFTSPIRRYADLVVHRALKRALGYNPGPTPAGGKIVAIADQLSANERKAMEAEREILKRLTVLFLRARMGETFTGVIASILDFGFFVELNEVLADGMVRLSGLDDDYYEYVAERQELVGERTGRIFRLGQAVRVRLADVNVVRLEVNLELLQDDDSDGLEAVPVWIGRKRGKQVAGRSRHGEKGGKSRSQGGHSRYSQRDDARSSRRLRASGEFRTSDDRRDSTRDTADTTRRETRDELRRESTKLDSDRPAPASTHSARLDSARAYSDRHGVDKNESERHGRRYDKGEPTSAPRPRKKDATFSETPLADAAFVSDDPRDTTRTRGKRDESNEFFDVGRPRRKRKTRVDENNTPKKKKSKVKEKTSSSHRKGQNRK